MINHRDVIINQFFNAKREGLAARYAASFAAAGADVDDALARAFEYAAQRLLAKSDDFDADDLERVVCWKMAKLRLDAIASAQRAHGRRSVKAATLVDGERDDEAGMGRVSVIDKASCTHYLETVRDADEGDSSVLQSKAIETVLKEHGISNRDYEIVDRILFCSADRKALAEEKGTTVGNVARVYCIWKQRLSDLASEVRKRYAELALKEAA